MLTTIDEVIYEANLINIAEEEVIAVHLDSASMIVRRLIGESFYSTVENERTQNTLRFLELKKGETYYAISFMLMSLNIISTGSGIVTRFDSSKSGEYNHQPEKIKEMINHYTAVAEKFITPYLPGSELNPGDNSTAQLSDSINEINRRISSI